MDIVNLIRGVIAILLYFLPETFLKKKERKKIYVYIYMHIYRDR